MKKILLIDDIIANCLNTIKILQEVTDADGNLLYEVLCDENGNNLGTCATKSANNMTIRREGAQLIREKIMEFDILLIDWLLVNNDVEINEPASFYIIKDIFDDQNIGFHEQLLQKDIFLVSGNNKRKTILTYSDFYQSYKEHFTLLFRPYSPDDNEFRLKNRCVYQDINENSDEKMCDRWEYTHYCHIEKSDICSKRECFINVFQKHIH